MRRFMISAAVLAALAATPAFAQPAPPPASADSAPLSHRASNIDQQDAHGVIAPALPGPDIGENAPARAYLHAAEGALATGKTGEAQQALEMAQTRLLDRSVPLGQANQPDANPAVGLISQALHALAAGDRAACMRYIQTAQQSLRATR